MSLTKCRMRIVTPREGKISTRCLFRGTGVASAASSSLRFPLAAALYTEAILSDERAVWRRSARTFVCFSKNCRGTCALFFKIGNVSDWWRKSALQYEDMIRGVQALRTIRGGCQRRHASTASVSTSPSASVASLLDSVDRPSSLASRFYPSALRPHFLAIRAFNAEVARVAESVENELMARIRVAWWRDAVQATFQGKATRHPTMLALADAIHDPLVLRNGGLVEDHFISICDAREAELSAPSSPPTLEEVERYAEKTSSRLFYLSLNLLGVSSTVCDEVFSHLGKARGISQLLSSVPFHAGVIQTTSTDDQKRTRGTAKPRSRRLILPAEYLFAHGVVEEDVYRRGADAKGLRDAVFDTATRAHDYIITAQTLLRTHFKKPPSTLTGPMAEAAATTTFLSALQKSDFDIFDPSLQLVASGRGWQLPWNMWKVGWRGTI